MYSPVKLKITHSSKKKIFGIPQYIIIEPGEETVFKLFQTIDMCIYKFCGRTNI